MGPAGTSGELHLSNCDGDHLGICTRRGRRGGDTVAAAGHLFGDGDKLTQAAGELSLVPRGHQVKEHAKTALCPLGGFLIPVGRGASASARPMTSSMMRLWPCTSQHPHQFGKP